MWRRVHLHSRAIAAMTLNPSGGPPHGGGLSGSKTVVADDKVVFMALGTFFGLIFLLFGIQIYVRCVWRRIQTSVDEMEDDEGEEMAPRADIYIREVGGRRNWRRRLNHYFDERSDSSSPAQHIPVGLDKSVLDVLPTFLFNADPAAFCDETAREIVCAVCLEEFQDGERARLLPKCSHCFHAQCIDMWFLSHSSCPLCRCQVSAPSPETMGDPRLRNSRSCPDLSQMSLDPSEQQQEPWHGPSASIVPGFRDSSRPEEHHAASFSAEGDIVSHASASANVSNERASIVGVYPANDALYLERGSYLSRRAAAVALEMSDDESISIFEEEDQQVNSSQEQASEVEVEITPDIPSPGSQLPNNSPGSTPSAAYQSELLASTSSPGGPELLEEDTSRGSPHHSRKRSFLAVEIISEYELDASGTTSEEDISPARACGLQPS